MRKALGFVIVIMCAVISVSAQSSAEGRQARKHHAEDKSAVLRADKVAPKGAELEFVPHTAFSYPVDNFKPGVVQVGPRTTYLKEGLRTDEVVRLLGKPASILERKENNVTMTTYQFQRGEGRILIAEFENGVLVRSRMESTDEPVVADR